jgi:hypothetical protein
VAPSIRKKLAITSPTGGGLSVGIVRSRTQTTEFFLCGSSFLNDRITTDGIMPRKLYDALLRLKKDLSFLSLWNFATGFPFRFTEEEV